MSQFLESFEVFDLALGKPPLYCLPSSAFLHNAIDMLKELSLSEISIWNDELSECLGVVNNLDILCFLASDERNLTNLDYTEPISMVFHKSSIQHVNLHDRLSKALELMTRGVQYLIVPLPATMKKNKCVNPRWPWKELCWISQEAVMRFLMSCIAAFCPVPLFTIEELGIINRNFISVDEDSPAISAIDLIRTASENMTALAVVHHEESLNTTNEINNIKLIGDISSASLKNYEEQVAASALVTLTASEFLSYVHGGKRSSRVLGDIVKSRLMQKLSVDEHSSSRLVESIEDSSDSEQDSSSSFSTLKSASSGLQRNRNCLTCRPWSSLAAVMAQALSHRYSYIWVTDAENTLVGIVTYVDVIRVLVKKVDKAGRSASSQKLFSSTPKAVVSR